MLGEHTIADIAEEAAPSVVNINTKTNIVIPRSHVGFGFSFGNLSPFGSEEPHIESKGSGSGLIVRSNGYILTNNHVIRNANEIIVTLNDGRNFKASVVGKDKLTDLSLLKIDADNLPAAKFGNSLDIRPGDFAIAIGSPLGLDHSVTLGIISALGRSVGAVSNDIDLIQTDAAINPGNSGGPLLNLHGEVIGINAAIRADGQNIGFAIPSDLAREVTDQLLEKGKVSRAYVGVFMQTLDPKVNKALGLNPNLKGVLIAKIAEAGPAAQAGLEAGDIIQKVDGQPVINSKEVQTLVRKHPIGDHVSLQVLRDGKLESFTLKIADYPAD
jgi:S1-C subfamily serine protease